MRLIDLDKAMSICDEDNNAVIFANIENAEVKAIPIEWIKKWRRDKWQGGEPIEKRMIMAMGVRLLLEDWEKENEIN